MLLLAGSDLAQSHWEKELITWIGNHDQGIYGLGIVGFDIDQIAWQVSEFEPQKTFLLRVIDTARQRHRWDVLDYDPPYVADHLLEFRKLVSAYNAEMVDSDKNWDWFAEPDPHAEFVKCPQHQVYEHVNGCAICND